MNTATKTFRVTGMHCASCASIVTRQLKKAPGVEQCDVSLTWEQAEVSGQPEALTPQKLNPFLSKFGYALEETSEHAKEKMDLKTVWLSGTAIMVFFVMAGDLISRRLRQTPLVPEEAFHWVVFFLAIFNWSLTVRRFGKAVWMFVRSRVASMDTLIGIGTGAALVDTMLRFALPTLGVSLGLHTHTYADVVVIVIGFVYLGQSIEKRLRKQTVAALNSMQERFAKTVLLERDGVTQETTLSLVKAGDVVRVGAGVVIPVDGIVLEGSSTVNESAFTGESLPVEKTVGQLVYAGTLNTTGSLRIQTQAVGDHTRYGQAATSVLAASRAKASIERLTDRISARFVPAVLIVAVVTALSWVILGPIVTDPQTAQKMALSSTLAVLVIACPCALGLATPVAVSATLGQLLKQGVFVRRPQLIEHLGSCTHIVFDKTGTLTIGRPLVRAITLSQHTPLTESTAVGIAAGLEADSQHPLATALQLYAEEHAVQPATLTALKTIPGRGVEGLDGHTHWRIGSEEWLNSLGISTPSNISQHHSGASLLHLVREQEHQATFVLQDELRPRMRETIQALQNQGKTIVLLSGDSTDTTGEIAKAVGIQEWRGRVSPEEKTESIRSLQANGFKVLMIGDGINDTAALAEATASIAISSGSDTALSVADATVFSSALEKLPTVVQLGAFGMRIIRENLFWAFAYNALCIPLAAGVFYPALKLTLSPELAGALMSVSSISVVANALRVTAASTTRQVTPKKDKQ